MKAHQKVSLLFAPVALAGLFMSLTWLESDGIVSSDITEMNALRSEQQDSNNNANEPSSQAPHTIPNTSSEENSVSESGHWKQSLPRQFHDTDVTGVLRTDDQGNFIPDILARQVFDYFLTAQDDVELDQIKEWLSAYIDENLQPPANQQALAVLERYLEYKTQLNQLSVDQGVWDRLYDPYQSVTHNDLKSLSRVFRERQGLQRQLFDQNTQQAMFAEENEYDDYMLQRLQVSLSNQSQEEINQQLQALEKQQNPEAAAFREASQVALKHKDIDSSLTQADNATKYQTYSQTYGDEAANRLMALQDKRQAFSQKRTRYLEFKSALGEDNQSDALNDFMRHELMLTEGEIKRMQTLDKLDAEKLNNS